MCTVSILLKVLHMYTVQCTGSYYIYSNRSYYNPVCTLYRFFIFFLYETLTVARRFRSRLLSLNLFETLSRQPPFNCMFLRQ